MKSTLTALSGLVLLIGAAILAFPNLQDQPKTSQKSTSSLVVKTPRKIQVSKETQEPVTVQFGLNVNFSPKPTTETEQ